MASEYPGTAGQAASDMGVTHAIAPGVYEWERDLCVVLHAGLGYDVLVGRMARPLYYTCQALESMRGALRVVDGGTSSVARPVLVAAIEGETAGPVWQALWDELGADCG